MEIYWDINDVNQCVWMYESDFTVFRHWNDGNSHETQPQMAV